MNKLMLANCVAVVVAAAPEHPIEHDDTYLTPTHNGYVARNGNDDWHEDDSWVLFNKNIESKRTDPKAQVGGHRNFDANVDAFMRGEDAHKQEKNAHTDGNWAGLRHGLTMGIWNLRRWEYIVGQEELYDMGNPVANGQWVSRATGYMNHDGNGNPMTDDHTAASHWVPVPLLEDVLTVSPSLPQNPYFRYEMRVPAPTSKKPAGVTDRSVYFKATTLHNLRSDWSNRHGREWTQTDERGHDLDHQGLKGWDYHNGVWKQGDHKYGDLNKDDWCPVIGMFDAEGVPMGLVLNTKDHELNWNSKSYDLCNASQNASKALKNLITDAKTLGGKGWTVDEKTGEWKEQSVKKQADAKKAAEAKKAGDKKADAKKTDGCCGCSTCCCVMIISLIVLAVAGVIVVMCCCCKKADHEDDSL